VPHHLLANGLKFLQVGAKAVDLLAQPTHTLLTDQGRLAISTV
jgi:hypothetical protein